MNSTTSAPFVPVDEALCLMEQGPVGLTVSTLCQGVSLTMRKTAAAPARCEVTYPWGEVREYVKRGAVA